MTNLELAGKLQASSARNDDLVGLLWDAGAALRNLHTENTALRVTEENLRQELQECQDQRRAAFRRIEELEQRKPLTDEPDWRHPKIQGLIGSEARLRIAIDLIWQILEDPEKEFTASDMEYWDTIHDKLKDALSAAAKQQPLTDEQINQMWSDAHNDTSTMSLIHVLVRAIEAAHNIGEKK